MFSFIYKLKFILENEDIWKIFNAMFISRGIIKNVFNRGEQKYYWY